MRHLKVLVLFFVLLHQQVYGQCIEAETYLNRLEQQLISSDSLINSCRILSKQFVKKQNFSAAIYCAHREANYLQKKNSTSSKILKKQAEVQFNLAKLYRRISKYDMALKCIQAALFYYQEPSITDSTILIEIYFFCAQTQYLQGKYQHSEYSLDSMNRLLALNKSRVLCPKDSVELLILKGSINLKKGDLSKAEKQFKIAAHKHLHSPTVPPLLLSQIYNNLGFIKIEKEAIYAAISYFSKVIDRSKAKDITYFTNFKLIYSNLGFCYFRLKQYKKALAYHTKSLRLLSRLYPHDNEHTAFVYNHIGGTYHKLHAADSALYYTNKSIQTYQKVFGAQSLALISPLHQKASLYKAQKKYVYAEKIYLQLIKTQQNNFKKHPDLAALYLDLSMLYHQTNRYALAEKSIHKAWNANLSDDKILHPSLMIKILHQQLKLIRLTPQKKSQLYFHKIKKLDIIIAQSLYQLHGKADKKHILTHLRALCNHGIAFCYDWYNKTKDQAYLERIFELMEYNKSVLLNLSIRAQLEYPKQDRQVKLHEFIERKWLDAWTNNDSTTLLNLQDQLFDQHWSADLNQQQSLQYKLIAVEDLQSMIDSQEIIFSYFWGTDAIYALLIEQKNYGLSIFQRI
jgi:tetratricopeptide (TPR) repeat protein